jgi:hypothetical protein
MATRYQYGRARVQQIDAPRFLFHTCMGSGATGLKAFAFCCSVLVVLATSLGRPSGWEVAVADVGVDAAEAVSMLSQCWTTVVDLTFV